MATEVFMPQLGESVVEGTVTKWLKQEGEAIEEFEPLVEINTDKVDTEVPSPATGSLLKLYVSEGETVKAGSLLAVIGKSGENVPEEPLSQTLVPEPSASEPAATPKPAAPAPKPKAPSQGPAEMGFISPVVAKISAEHNVDLTQIRGTGQGGRITKKDVLAFVEKSSAAPWDEPASGELFRPSEEVFGQDVDTELGSPGTVQPLDAVRKSIAEHMVRSKDVSPHVTTVMEADLSNVVDHRAANKAAFTKDGANLTFTTYFTSASCEALKEMPIVNSSWSDEGIVLHPDINIGIAVSLGTQGLIVPVIRNADQLSLLAMSKSIDDLATRARDKKLVPDDVQGGRFTITNHGVSGSLMATPIINQPQCAILGVGAIQKRVVVVESTDSTGRKSETIAIRPMLYLTLTFDHRIIDGALADQFLGLIVQRLDSWS
jgi:2-oxoglutarate dehydrogenase E2 component (dihydrolipoamide succinyltransferase)